MLMAATRDASDYNRPNTRTPKKWHIVGADECSACRGKSLVMESAEPAEDVPVERRCMRHGCREKWPMMSNDRVEGRDAALSRRVPSHDGLEG